MAKYKKRGIVDLSSVIWTCLFAGKDTEFGREVISDGKKYQVNSASYGYENSLNHLLFMMDKLKLVPVDLIFVAEGKNSKAERQNIHPAYKANRDKCDEQYVEFNKIKESLIELFLNLGSQVVWQDGGVEADDVIGYLALHLQGERWIISGDKDLAVLVNPERGINHYRRGVINENPLGPFDHKYIPVYFAVVGDPGDKIPGARGFGKTYFDKMLTAFGNEGLEALYQLILKKDLKRLEEDVAELKCLQIIIDDAPNVYMSYELARLRIEKVNTMRRPLTWLHGMVKPKAQIEEDRLRKFGGEIRLVSAENYDEMYAWASKEVPKSPDFALDIEGSTPEESDAWLEAAGRTGDNEIDIFGSTVTSIQITFGNNNQYTVYLPVDNVEEPGVANLTVQQAYSFIRLLPKDRYNYVHNTQYELVVLKNTGDI